MELQRLCDVEGGKSVEERIGDAVKGMEAGERLRTVMDLVRKALDAEEIAQEVAAEAWEMVKREEWWRAEYETWAVFKERCGISQSMAELIRKRGETLRLKRKFEAEAAQAWGGSSLKAILGELIPERPGKGFLESMRTLSRCLPDVDTAKKLLEAEKDGRKGVALVEKGDRLQIRDVQGVLKLVKARGQKALVAKDKGFTRQNAAERQSVLAEPNDEDSELESETEEFGRGACKCEDIAVTNDLVSKVTGSTCLGGKLKVLEGIDGRGWRQVCHDHVRVIASSLELKTSELKREELISRMIEVQGRSETDLWGEEESQRWFRKRGRPAGEEDKLGPFKYARIGQDGLEFDREAVWLRYGGEGAMERFLEEGNVVVTGLLDWIVKDSELMRMVDAEFEMYRHHLREQNGRPNWGWCRNMWHSLVQQAIRQDPGLYALHVAARGDGRWRLVSHPYYTKYADKGDSTGFKHIDLNIPNLVKHGRGENVVQTAVSMDDEWEGGCTVVVPGFHRNIKEWWEKVESRGEAKGGWTHSVEKTYRAEDAEEYGEFVPVVCSRGDVRMTMAPIIHGSTKGCDRIRRVVYPWLIGVEEDGEKLEMSGLYGWEEVSRAHRDMAGMKKGPTGDSHRFGVGEGRFGGCVEMRGVSGLGDALVGGRRWDSREVLMERDVVLGDDDVEAWKYVRKVRWELREKWKGCFRQMVAAEVVEFGENSYFGSLEGLARAAGIN
jgi:Phytanoyl-CoA dioxygenase (PhyH)